MTEEAAGSLESRVARLEVIVTGIAASIQTLTTTVERVAQIVATVGKPDLRLMLSIATFLLLFITAVGGMAVLPIRAEQAHGAAQVAQALQWQEDYTRGKIPSSAEKEINTITATLRESLREVETQFHAFENRMIENETLMTKGLDANTTDLKALLARQADNRERLATLEERSRHPEGK